MTSLLYKTIFLQTVAVKSDPLTTPSIKTDDDITESTTISNKEIVTINVEEEYDDFELVEVLPTQPNIAYKQLTVVDDDGYI